MPIRLSVVPPDARRGERIFLDSDLRLSFRAN
jgi:hypothetical protein